MSNELHRVCELILAGRNQFADGDLLGAEQTFVHLKGTAITDAVRNCARLHLGTIYGIQFWPGKFKSAADTAENMRWMGRAVREYEELLEDCPTDDQKECALANLAALRTMRIPV